MSTVIPGEKHYCATVVVISDSVPAKALLQHHRKHDRWMPPGGHQESNENPIEAAIRETLEESGVDISAVIAKPRFTGEGLSFLPLPDYFLEEPIPAHGGQPAHFHLDQVYVVRVPQQAIKLAEAESHDIGWFTLEETETMNCFKDMHEILRKELAS